MTTSTSESAANKRLKKTIKEQSEEITRLQKRLNQVVDDVYCIKQDISNFKSAVSKDMITVNNNMKGIVESIQKQ